MRLTHTVARDNRTVRIYRDTVWNEIICKLFVDGEHQKEADYMTDDYEDALETAEQMSKGR